MQKRDLVFVIKYTFITPNGTIFIKLLRHITFEIIMQFVNLWLNNGEEASCTVKSDKYIVLCIYIFAHLAFTYLWRKRLIHDSLRSI